MPAISFSALYPLNKLPYLPSLEVLNKVSFSVVLVSATFSGDAVSGALVVLVAASSVLLLLVL